MIATFIYSYIVGICRENCKEPYGEITEPPILRKIINRQIRMYFLARTEGCSYVMLPCKGNGDEMSGMIDRVAKAIWECSTIGSVPLYECERFACAAIEAIREPTKEMLEDMTQIIYSRTDNEFSWEKSEEIALLVFQAGIDIAVTDKSAASVRQRR